ncbi:MAG TPA: SAM-dependent chlorinase/fluorinase, partial [Candidatus Methanomethylicus sp.]|nr:SAM-dependent chlorinase/fluorinase [Candidatus Methanomethylicus sp.]
MLTIVTLTTDFHGHYVGVMKGVIKSLSPATEVIDLSTEVEPFGLKGGAFILCSSYKYFPKGTIHLVVVDPGVGTSRKAIVIKTKNYIFVGPDNGVMAPAAEEDGILEVYEIGKGFIERREVAPTFNGRDIFAPVAAYLADGGNLKELGKQLHRFERVEFKRTVGGDFVFGEVIYADMFGNLTTSIREQDADLTGGKMQITDKDGKVIATLDITGNNLQRWLIDADVQ